MFDRVKVVGRGRVGSAVATRLAERARLAADGDEPDLVLLCVPDRAIHEAAAAVPPGPWLAHVSGAVSLSALSPHERRFGVHPLQTFNRSGRADQLDGAWAAVTADTEDARIRGRWLATTLALQPFDLRDDRRVLYHAGATVASNFLVTLFRAARDLVQKAGVPPDALLPLMRRTMENGFELTGPIARGDWATVEAHVAAIRVEAPELEELYRTLARVTRP
ncbi:MAG TPA: DUF2520 domain-containing protein [Vicinamibacterales bacterium]|nr:DUF2520 domain-containing protein [Vicinamibacterales bacterium]